MLHAALDGALDDVPTRTDATFGLEVPTSCPDVPTAILDPRSTWKDGAAYDQKAAELARKFQENFRPYAEKVSAAVREAGPKAG
jgi:phosphoenolpyruvate carboxykinase (ATP)